MFYVCISHPQCRNMFSQVPLSVAMTRVENDISENKTQHVFIPVHTLPISLSC